MKQKGLNDIEVLESRKKYGTNILTPKDRIPLWKKFMGKFSDPLIIILLVAGVLSLGISSYEYFGLDEKSSVFFEPVGIFVAILLSTGLAFYFEMKADKEFTILNQVNDDEPVKVVRNAQITEVPRKDIVVGDVVVLSAGDEIPADGTLIESVSLSVDESSLTGEPICRKTTNEADFDTDATYPSNRLLRGTNVMEGHAVYMVDMVGDCTENGKVFKEAQIDSSVKTPLNEQLEKLSKLITKASYILATLIIVGKIYVYVNDSVLSFSALFSGKELIHFVAYILNTFMLAVTLIVVAVPEGLPMAVTLSLAYSMRRMLRTNNLVRKMHACETMGATTVICTDKTGTLTQNQMRVAETDFCDDEELMSFVKEGLAVNSTAHIEDGKIIGNPTEGALLLWLESNGVDYRAQRTDVPKLDEIPFSTENKFMASVVRSGVNGRKILYLKGAPEIISGMCHQTCGHRMWSDIESRLKQWQRQAMRTIAFAYQILDETENGICDGKIIADRLEFLGAVAISDPVRKEVPGAIDECQRAGINVKIVTGDTPATAVEIGRQVGLWTDNDSEQNVITGPEFEKLSDEELDNRVLDIKIISRARPMDKKRLVEFLQKKGQVVAVTGDGTNDAPALNAAHVGLSMGDGTSVAKEASDITIVDNSFSSISLAVMWGRSLYKNIQRFILFQLIVNVVACLTVLIGAFIGTENPITVTQMLWVNLIMDTFAAMALASLPPSKSVMNEKPRKRTDFIINCSMGVNIVVTGLLFTSLLIFLLLVFKQLKVDSIVDVFYPVLDGTGISEYELSLFFTIFVMLQFWNMFNAMAFGTKQSIFKQKNSKGFITIALLIIIGQILIVTFGGQMFNVTPLKIIDWIIIILSTSFVLWIKEIIKQILKS